MSNIFYKISKVIANPKFAFELLCFKAKIRTSDLKSLCDYLYYKTFKHKINWEKPEDLNQWIAWLQFKTDTSLWVILADKYRMHDYLKGKGFGEYLVPVLASWNSVDDIDFAYLPNGFVLKCNNGSGDVRIVTDKSKINISEIKEYFRQQMEHKFGSDTAEPHYLRIKPLIIAEQLLDANRQSTESTSLIDYKFWCFNGEIDRIFVCSDRSKGRYSTEMYDPDWNNISDTNIVHDAYTEPSKHGINKPLSFDTMKEIASAISKGFPQMRVDFYEVDGHPYVGELTMTAACGRMQHYTPPVLKEMGEKCGASVRELLTSGQLKSI